MPKHEQLFSISTTDNEYALAIAYQSAIDLNYKIIYIGNNRLVADTGGKWGNKGQEIVCVFDNDQVLVSSEMMGSEVVDVTNRNKKNVSNFIGRFNQLLSENNTAIIDRNKLIVSDVREQSRVLAEQQMKDMEEMDKVMNLTGSNLYVTYGLIAINIIIFILMLLDGAGLVEPNGWVHMKWGSNISTLTLTGDWWRVFTCMFLHFGVIHLLMNMYCMYTVGIYLEPMLGKIKYLAAYLCTGVIASIVSLWIHDEPANSAGASGAVFGLYGLF